MSLISIILSRLTLPPGLSACRGGSEMVGSLRVQVLAPGDPQLDISRSYRLLLCLLTRRVLDELVA